MELIDYSYYKDVYCGSLEETAFSKVYPKALAYFAGATRGRVKKADTNVCFALCAGGGAAYELAGAARARVLPQGRVA